MFEVPLQQRDVSEQMERKGVICIPMHTRHFRANFILITIFLI